MTGAALVSGEPWRRLSPLTVAAYAVSMAGIMLLVGVPTLLILAVTVSWRVALVSTVPAVVLLTLVTTLVGWLVWRATRYHVGSDRFRMRSGVLVHRELSLSRDRIRAVDITADPIYRLFGLARVQIGTGEQTGQAGSAVLSPVSREEATALRAELLVPTAAGVGRADGELARFRPAWVGYAPVSLTAMVVWAGCYILLGQQLDWIITDAGPWLLRTIGVPLLVLIGVAGPILIAVVASVALFVENWWNYRLERESGALVVHRGLLTTRATTLQESRLRGLEILEPLGTRLAGAAEIQAISTGLVNQSDHSDRDKTANRVTLVPYAPRSEVDRVAAAVLGVSHAPTDPDLRPHPVAARRRRLRWAILTLVAFALAAGALALVWSAGWIVLVVGLVVGIPGAAWVALDAYRSLGHRLDPAYLVTRSGSVLRRTAALERDGVIGWTVCQSIFQRRAQLATLTATTAAGSGGYRVVDVDATSGLRLAREVTPGLLEPFLDGQLAPFGSSPESSGAQPISGSVATVNIAKNQARR